MPGRNLIEIDYGFSCCKCGVDRSLSSLKCEIAVGSFFELASSTLDRKTTLSANTMKVPLFPILLFQWNGEVVYLFRDVCIRCLMSIQIVFCELNQEFGQAGRWNFSCTGQGNWRSPLEQYRSWKHTEGLVETEEPCPY